MNDGRESPNFFLIDGSNIVRSNCQVLGIRIGNLLALVSALIEKGCGFHCIFDANMRFVLQEQSSGEEVVFDQLMKDADHFSMVSGGQRADDPLLTWCKSEHHRIITGDRYRNERAGRHQWLQDAEEVWLVKPHVTKERLIVDALDIAVTIPERETLLSLAASLTEPTVRSSAFSIAHRLKNASQAAERSKRYPRDDGCDPQLAAHHWELEDYGQSIDQVRHEEARLSAREPNVEQDQMQTDGGSDDEGQTVHAALESFTVTLLHVKQGASGSDWDEVLSNFYHGKGAGNLPKVGDKLSFVSRKTRANEMVEELARAGFRVGQSWPIEGSDPLRRFWPQLNWPPPKIEELNRLEVSGVGKIQNLVYSPSLGLVAVHGHDSVAVHDIRSGSTTVLQKHTAKRKMPWGPDREYKGYRVLAIDEERSSILAWDRGFGICVWDLSGQPIGSFPTIFKGQGQNGWLTFSKFSQDGKYFACYDIQRKRGIDLNALALWSTQSGEKLWEIDCFVKEIIQVSNAGEVSTVEGAHIVRRHATGKEIPSPLDDSYRPVASGAFSEKQDRWVVDGGLKGAAEFGSMTDQSSWWIDTPISKLRARYEIAGSFGMYFGDVVGIFGFDPPTLMGIVDLEGAFPTCATFVAELKSGNSQAGTSLLVVGAADGLIRIFRVQASALCSSVEKGT